MKKYFMLAAALLTLTACGNSKEATEQSIALGSRETALESREKVLENKESEITDQSKTIESKEKSLDSREKAVATKESEQKAAEEETAYSQEAVQEEPEQVVNQPDETEVNEQAPEQQIAKYLIVQEGEGPQQVAERAGISTDELFELNGMTPDNYSFTPGDAMRIK